MLRKPLLHLALALVLFSAFAYGIARLFVLRYERGDVYPAYSTLRADPVGAKGVYEALGQLSGVTVRRNFQPLPKLDPPAPVTLIYVGVARYASWETREIPAFDELVLGGTRAVLTFRPFERSPVDAEIKRLEEEERVRKEKERAEQKEKEDAPDKKKKSEKTDDAKKKSSETKETSGLVSFTDVAKRWGLAFDFLPIDAEKKFQRRAVLQDTLRPLERELSWHTALFFKDLKPEWKVLYTCEGKPVVIERAYGRGQIVLAADSYLLSNEALRQERAPQFLAWLFRGPSDVVFDEEHHGVRDDPGIASLARKYRLHGVVAGLALLAALFVWKNSARFLPPYASDHTVDDIVAGQEASAGFVHLLRRSITPAQILEVCLAEWRKSFAHRPRELALAEELCAQERSRPARERQPVATYRALSRLISRKL